jgi:glycosyl transferase family 25
MQNSFQPLNDFFDKTFVLTLRGSERVAYIEQTLKGLNFEFFYGVDKNHASLEDLKQQGAYSREAYRLFYKNRDEMPLGMLCCALGHLQIYETIVQHGYQRTLILEDDVIPRELAAFPSIARELPPDWDLLYLGYEKNEKFGLKERINRIIYRLFPYHRQLNMTPGLYAHYYPKSISPHLSIAGFHDCTHAYAVTQATAQKLISIQKPVRFYSDNLLSWMIGTGKLQGYIAKPKLFDQLTAFVHKMPSLTVG